MSFFDEIILNTIFVLFFQLINIIYFMSKKNINEKDKEIVLDVCNFLTLYLIIKYNTNFSDIVVLMINIPLIISISRKKITSWIITSIIIVCWSIANTEIPYIYLILEYVFYFIFFKLIYTKNKSFDDILNPFILIKSCVLTIETFLIFKEKSDLEIITNIILSLIIFYFVSVFVLYIIEKGKEIVSLNQITKELEKEKTLKISLFKITHEVKNPLSVCKGYLSMMNYNDIEKVKKYNNIISNEINRTLDIMDAFSQYTKINIKKEKNNLTKLLNDTIDSIKLLSKSKNIEINFVNTNKEVYLDFDYDRMKQVIVNILKNSIEALNNNGKINITINKIKNYEKIVIEDNGTGINKEDLEKIGDMFYTTKENGTGIGVALCKEIIELHSGKIKYYSKLGKGTKVVIELPI